METNHDQYNHSAPDVPPEVQASPRPRKKKKYMKSRILSNPNVCGGEPVIKGTRIPVHIILSHLASGDDDQTILANFPKLKKEDIEACREYAEMLSRRRYREPF